MNKYSMSSFNNYLKSIPKITLLTYGESDLEILKEIKTSLVNAILDDNDKYAPSQGLLSTRNTIAKIENKKMGTNYVSDEVLITNGATEGLYLTINALLKEKDEIILLSPYYPEYEELANIHKLNKIVVKLNDNFQIDEKELVNKITKKTKAIIINTPNNPTGIMLNRDSLNILSRIAKKFNLYLICDYVYDSLTFTKMEYINDDNKERLIIINSLSKSYNLTGWRLGYILSSKEIINKLLVIKQALNVSMPRFLQKAMECALLQKVEYKKEYKKSVDLIFKTLKELKIDVIYPDGGYYLFFNIDCFKMDSITFCKILAEEYKIGLMPGAFFYKDNYVRLSCTKKIKDMMAIQKRLKKAFKKLKS